MTSIGRSEKCSFLFWNFSFVFVFIYFLTLSTDLINVDIGFFQLKLGHVVGSGIFIFLFCFKKSIIVERKLFLCLLTILSSTVVSSCFSVLFIRSFVYSFICLFTFCIYFVVPLSLMYCLDERKILRYYLASFFVIGAYAFLQFFSSIFGIELPFSVQKVIFVRGSALAHEPSFYALYAIPFVVFVNARLLISRALKDKSIRERISTSAFVEKKTNGKQFFLVFSANLFLLVSTATTCFFSYIVFFFILIFFKRYPSIKECFFGLRKKTIQASAVFLALLSLVGVMLSEVFEKTFLKFFYYGLTHESFNDRYQGIINAMTVFCSHPFFGVGLGGVGPLLYYEKMHLGSSEMLAGIDRLEIHTLEPTNVLTEILSCLGFYGLFGFALLIVVILKLFREVLDDYRLEVEDKVSILAFLISIVVMLVCLQINQGLFRSYIWVHMGIGIGYVLKVKARLHDC